MTEAAPRGPDLASDVALRDGSTVHVRPVRPEDRNAIRDFMESLSPESRFLRFFTGAVNLDWIAERMSDVGELRFGLLASHRDRVIAHAACIATDPHVAEVALAVADDFQGRGIGTILIGQLAETAQARGIELFQAEVMSANRKMIGVFQQSGFPASTRSESGVVIAEFPTSLVPSTLERYEEREQVAAVAAIRRFLAPQSIAVIGASRARGTIGGELFHQLRESGFTGRLFPIDRPAQEPDSVAAVPLVEDLPEPVDLAIIASPPDEALEVAEACGRLGVGALIVVSSGFAEAGPAGIQRQHELVDVCRRYGMRLIGPNCLGVINTDPAVRLNATPAPGLPPRGRVALMAQSGAIGLAAIERSDAMGIGLSSFVSVGNKADISGNDLLAYWKDDPDTDLILLYLESFGNPRKFGRLTRQIGRTKPILAVKGGRSIAGSRATASHTGELVAASDVTVDALFRQAGVIRTDTLSEMLDVAVLMTTQPLPTGRRVGIVANAGGPGVLCADACEAAGLEVPTLDESTQAALSSRFEWIGSTDNPVHLPATASGEDYRRAVDILAQGGIDSLIVVHAARLGGDPDDVVSGLAASMAARSRPVVSVCLGRETQVGRPWFAFPEEAARALAHVVRYSEWRAREDGRVRSFDDADPERAAELVRERLKRGVAWLDPESAHNLLKAYGIPLAGLRQSSSTAEVVATERLRATDPSRQREEPAYEMLIGVLHDPAFGPVIACGTGGALLEVVGDVSVRVAPLTDVDVHEMVRSLQSFQLLDGKRGAPRVAVEALEEILTRVSALVESHPEVAEMDLNPVLVTSDGATVLDARVRLEAPRPALPLSARRS